MSDSDSPISSVSEETLDHQKQRRHGRRAAAGRSGGEFELLRHGNQLTYRYVSPDSRRLQPEGQYFSGDTPSNDGHGDFDARSMHTLSEHDSTPKTSPLSAVCENANESLPNTFDTILNEPIAQNHTPPNARYHGYVESVYSDGSYEESFHEDHSPTIVDRYAPEDTLNDTMTEVGLKVQLAQVHKVRGVRTSDAVEEDQVALDGINLQSPVKKKSFAEMTFVKEFVKQIIQKRTRAIVAGNLSRLFGRTFGGERLVTAREPVERNDNPQKMKSRLHEPLHNPSTPKAQIMERKSDLSAKEQQLREHESNLPQEKRETTFVTPPADNEKSDKGPSASQDLEVFH